MSLNVRGLGNRKKRLAVFRFFHRKQADIIFIQESHSTVYNEVTWLQEWGGPIHFSHGTNNSRGCLILIKPGLDLEIITIKKDYGGRFVIAKVTLDDKPMILMNVYFPNTEKEQLYFIDDLLKIIKSMNIESNNSIILGGDFNLIQNIQLDKKGGLNTHKSRSKDKLNSMLLLLDLNDSWRIKNPNTTRFTWRQKNPFIHCRLDYFFISNILFDEISAIDILPSLHSDHSVITVNFQPIARTNKGPGLWKFNNKLLNDLEYIESLSNEIRKWNLEYEMMADKCLLWELFKYNIRNFTIRYSKNKVKHIRCKESGLEKRLMVLEHENHLDKIIAKEYEDVKKKLSIIENEKIDGLILRSKVKWHEEGEKSTRYFFNLEKQNANRKHIRKLKLENGREITDAREILKEQKRFYSKLYNQKVDKSEFDINSKLFLDSQDIPTLEDNNKNVCEGNLTEKECFKSLQTFKKNKSPGNDGLSYEFHLIFWNVLKNRFVECFNYAYTTKQMSSSQRQAVITLLDKK